MMRKAKFRIGQRVRLRREAKVYKIREKLWDEGYGMRGGSWRYRMEGESDYWIPVEKILRAVKGRKKAGAR